MEGAKAPSISRDVPSLSCSVVARCRSSDVPRSGVETKDSKLKPETSELEPAQPQSQTSAVAVAELQRQQPQSTSPRPQS